MLTQRFPDLKELQVLRVRRDRRAILAHKVLSVRRDRRELLEHKALKA